MYKTNSERYDGRPPWGLVIAPECKLWYLVPHSHRPNEWGVRRPYCGCGKCYQAQVMANRTKKVGMKVQLDIVGFGQESIAGKTVSWFEVHLPGLGTLYKVQIPNALYAEFSELVLSGSSKDVAELEPKGE